VKTLQLSALILFFSLCFSITALCGDATMAVSKKKASTAGCCVKAVSPDTAKQTTAAAVSVKPSRDTLVVIARCIEIPGKFAANDLYNYVYIMKYRVTTVVQGPADYRGQEILVGHYNPLIPRQQIKDKMRPFVRGNVTKFEIGAKHTLTLITPIERVWKDAVEDDYADSDLDKYFALTADVAR
jgi:hypothetical protein